MNDESGRHPERTREGSRDQRSATLVPRSFAGVPAQDDTRRVSALVGTTPAIIIVATCCALPLAWNLIVITTNPTVWADINLSSFRLDLLARTLGYNFGAAIIATAMGLPAGLVLGRGRGWIARAMWFIVPAALFMPSLAFAYGWAELVRASNWLFRPVGLTFFP